MRNLILELERINEAKKRANKAISDIVGQCCLISIVADTCTPEASLSLFILGMEEIKPIDFKMDECGYFVLSLDQSVIELEESGLSEFVSDICVILTVELGGV